MIWANRQTSMCDGVTWEKVSRFSSDSSKTDKSAFVDIMDFKGVSMRMDITETL